MTAEPERKPWIAMKHPALEGWMVYEEAPGIEPAVIIARGLTEENARLLVSAPAMLLALRLVINNHENGYGYAPNADGIRNVIARAEPGK